VIGLFVGPAQAASRSLMAHLTPPERQAEYFGLFALSGRATAFAGPAAVGLITDAFANQRAGMAAIIGFLAAGLALLITVPDKASHLSGLVGQRT
jgi:UMF1 family MFS transporter